MIGLPGPDDRLVVVDDSFAQRYVRIIPVGTLPFLCSSVIVLDAEEGLRFLPQL